MIALRSTSHLAPAANSAVLLATLVAVCTLLVSIDAFAIDGNYSSPYASQWDSRNTAARLPGETFLGLFLFALNSVLIGFFYLRNRFRRRAAL